MERTQVIIDDNKRAITIRTATGTFTQSGVSKPIIDYITTLQKENDQLKKRNKEIYDGYISATQELTEYAEENETLKELNVCVGCNNNPDYKSRIDKAINKIDYIIDYGFDYDGFDNKEDLKKLIDMLVEYAKESKDILQGYDGFME